MEIKYGHRLESTMKDYPTYHESLIKNSIVAGEADLRQYSSPRKNQGRVGCCVASSITKALEIKRIMNYGIDKHVTLSTLDLYYGARALMDPPETAMDNGTEIYLACEVLKTFGVCREQKFPFEDKNLFIPPPILATREAYVNKIVASYKILSTGQDRVQDVINNLQVGNPVVFGTLVDNKWMSYQQSSQPLAPVKFEDGKGGHAICIVGWVKGLFIIENSWGDSWGDNGYCWVQPEVIAANNSNDFWIMSDSGDRWFK